MLEEQGFGQRSQIPLHPARDLHHHQGIDAQRFVRLGFRDAGGIHAQDLGINALEIRGGLAGSTVLDAKAPLVMDRKFNPGFKINLHIKDLQNVLDTSHELGVPLPLTAAVMEIMQALKTDGKGDNDHGGLIQYYEKVANIEVKR